jgi:DNA-directed RNA polymerase subunit K/omega
LREFDKETGNIYESVAILSKRANQIAVELKEDFQERAKDFASHNHNNNNQDVFEETNENKEQVELARFYEQLPKPAVLAIHEFEHKEIHFKSPEK